MSFNSQIKSVYSLFLDPVALTAAERDEAIGDIGMTEDVRCARYEWVRSLVWWGNEACYRRDPEGALSALEGEIENQHIRGRYAYDEDLVEPLEAAHPKISHCCDELFLVEESMLLARRPRQGLLSW